MGVSRSALSHAIIGLEGKLGIRLLNRTTRSVSPTQAGARLLARLDPLLQDLDQALDTLSEARGTPSGELRINANKSGARILLRDIVPRFLELYPGVELDLVSEGRLVDIVEQGFDAGVRLLEAVPQDMVAVKFGGEVRFIAVAAPSYLQGREPPDTPDDLHAHSCIRQRLPSGNATGGSSPDAAPKSRSTSRVPSPSTTTISWSRPLPPDTASPTCRNTSRGPVCRRGGWSPFWRTGAPRLPVSRSTTRAIGTCHRRFVPSSTR